MKERKRIYLSPPHMSGREYMKIEEAFKSNWIAPLGPLVNQFEQVVADYAGVKKGAALSSGTAAIHLALKLIGVQKGDVVFCSSLTFVATANPILYEQATPVFIDSERDTWNMCPLALEKALIEAKRLGKRPRAVIVVHLYGQSAKMDDIMALCEAYDVPIIEDAAESLGALYKGRKSGSMGRYGVYSFNGNKIITTSGGGMLVSDDEDAIERCRFLASQARERAMHYEHQEMGYNYRMSNLLAGVGIAQMDVLDERVEQKRRIFQRYEDALSGVGGLHLMPEYKETKSNRWLTTLTIDRDAQMSPVDIIDALEKEQIEARRVWKPLHQQPLFRNYPFYTAAKGTPESELLFQTGLCLPSGTSMTDAEQDRIIDTLHEVLQEKTFTSSQAARS
ncbi:DegT/DnrJ/EryC1/StrS family aminotransferase [Bacillus sp. 28A-2]|uniref:DegT/DnrJ/EryC1/StrS family aminotransferase n=1 Tax=Bacillus sp. 28A-2 TaxID=2772252 RepID=UPI00168D860B|nr:aminotransferase class I/II-fold pyridoxal phosphate-dependent enzyme [Bacillus sp. 28A-2]MBD3859363.1 DegT/DnrJ/EryC1/StrS family aminotransferase [Bacillus sp. 28A-2]